MVCDVATLMGAVYVADDAVGLLPSVVYLVVAPLVALLIVTDCAEVYVPAAGLNVGAATVGVAMLMVYAVDDTAELVIPAFAAKALIVCDADTFNGDAYTDDEVVGVLPSVV